MLGSIIALFIFACIWNDITGPIKRDNFLRKLHSLGNPYGVRISVKVATDSGSRLPLIGAQRR